MPTLEAPFLILILYKYRSLNDTRNDNDAFPYVRTFFIALLSVIVIICVRSDFILMAIIMTDIVLSIIIGRGHYYDYHYDECQCTETAR